PATGCRCARAPPFAFVQPRDFVARSVAHPARAADRVGFSACWPGSSLTAFRTLFARLAQSWSDQRSYAPTSGFVGSRGFPSKSFAGAPCAVPAFTHAE